MKRMGICDKCGEYRLIVDHHYKGYNTDDVKSYCYSCDKIAHLKARKEGRCLLDSKETHKISSHSSKRRYNKAVNKTITLSSTTMEPYVRMCEMILLNTNTGHMNFSSFFHGDHDKKLKYIDI